VSIELIAFLILLAALICLPFIKFAKGE